MRQILLFLDSLILNTFYNIFYALILMTAVIVLTDKKCWPISDKKKKEINKLEKINFPYNKNEHSDARHYDQQINEYVTSCSRAIRALDTWIVGLNRSQQIAIEMKRIGRDRVADIQQLPEKERTPKQIEKLACKQW